MVTDIVSRRIFNCDDPYIIVAVGHETLPPADCVDVTVAKDRVTSRKVMVTPLGKYEIPNTIYPATLCGRPNAQIARMGFGCCGRGDVAGVT